MKIGDKVRLVKKDQDPHWQVDPDTIYTLSEVSDYTVGLVETKHRGYARHRFQVVPPLQVAEKLLVDAGYVITAPKPKPPTFFSIPVGTYFKWSTPQFGSEDACLKISNMWTRTEGAYAYLNINKALDPELAVEVIE